MAKSRKLQQFSTHHEGIHDQKTSPNNPATTILQKSMNIPQFFSQKWEISAVYSTAVVFIVTGFCVTSLIFDEVKVM